MPTGNSRTPTGVRATRRRSFARYPCLALTCCSTMRRKRRQFDGIVSAGDAQRSGEAPLHIDGKGVLNGKEASLQIIGDPLSRVRAKAPYAFTFDERSSGSRLTAEGSLLHGLNLQELDATFAASGADLKDMYYLTGTKLLRHRQLPPFRQAHAARQHIAVP